MQNTLNEVGFIFCVLCAVALMLMHKAFFQVLVVSGDVGVSAEIITEEKMLLNFRVSMFVDVKMRVGFFTFGVIEDAISAPGNAIFAFAG